ncbi:hypothetical protein VP01_8518g2 [Puccinia sorghi]|uniref:Uncharacterized protein n=1 Tax=Puccinia sorghi TaxID=27349 RepID=A0A0L6UB89_9BASI|nr:hypothetical protein VP01_8518g2 [Puccinia sorghi]
MNTNTPESGHTNVMSPSNPGAATPASPNVSANFFEYLEEENRRLKSEVESLKHLLHGIAINTNSINTTPTAATPPKAKKSTQKSITPVKLKKENVDHNLENIDLSHVGNKLLTSCYTHARCMMKHGVATDPVPDPPSSQERNRIEGYFESCDGPPGDNAGSRISQHEITAIEGNSKIDTDYVKYIHATIRQWGISCFTMDWDKHWDDRFNQILCQFFIRVWKWGLACNCFGLIVSCAESS